MRMSPWGEVQLMMIAQEIARHYHPEFIKLYYNS